MSSNNELWQGYDESGHATKAVSKQQCREGALHGSVHIWVYRIQNGTVEVLLQKRSSHVLTWPGYYDISAAGHIDYGERPIETALRESKEEIGLDIHSADIQLIFVCRTNELVPDSDVIENELQWVYCYELRDGINLGPVDEGEVSSTLWLPIEYLMDMHKGYRIGSGKVVPKDEVYLSKLYSGIHQSITSHEYNLDKAADQAS